VKASVDDIRPFSVLYRNLKSDNRFQIHTPKHIYLIARGKMPNHLRLTYL